MPPLMPPLMPPPLPQRSRDPGPSAHGVRWARLVEPVRLSIRSSVAVGGGRAVRTQAVGAPAAQAVHVPVPNAAPDRAPRSINARDAVVVFATVVGSLVIAAAGHVDAERVPPAATQGLAAALPGPALGSEPLRGALASGPPTASAGARLATGSDAPQHASRIVPASDPAAARVSHPPRARQHPPAARDRPATAAAGPRRGESPPATGPAPAPDPVAPPEGSAGPLTLTRAAAPFFIGRMDLVSEPRRVQLAPAGSDPAAPAAWRRVGDAPAPGWTVLGIAPLAVTLLTPGGTVVNLVP
jgi:hypothetical protein